MAALRMGEGVMVLRCGEVAPEAGLLLPCWCGGDQVGPVRWLSGGDGGQRGVLYMDGVV